jgi:hypothetical protein
MKAILTVVPAILLAACASTGPSSYARSSSGHYWHSTTAGDSQFPSDNLACSERAARLGRVSGPAPVNRLDAPVQRWANSTAEETYEACMLERGWHPNMG